MMKLVGWGRKPVSVVDQAGGARGSGGVGRTPKPKDEASGPTTPEELKESNPDLYDSMREHFESMGDEEGEGHDEGSEEEAEDLAGSGNEGDDDEADDSAAPAKPKGGSSPAPASLAELKAIAKGDADFVLTAHEAQMTVPQAKASFALVKDARGKSARESIPGGASPAGEQPKTASSSGYDQAVAMYESKGMDRFAAEREAQRTHFASYASRRQEIRSGAVQERPAYEK